MAGSVGLQRRTSSPAAGPGLKSGEGKARAWETRARQVSWALDGASASFWGLWCSGAVLARRRRGSAWRGCAGERLGFGAAAAVEVRCRGCGCGLKREDAGDLGVRA